MERVNGVAPSSRPWHARILLLNHTRLKWCPPTRNLTSNLEFRTLPLCALSYGDGKVFRATQISDWLTGSVSVSPSPEERSLLLLVKPAKEFPKPRIRPNLLDRVKRVAQFVMRPRFVDEVLTRMAGRRDVTSTFAARHSVVPSCGHLPVAERANFIHTVRPIFLQKHIHSCR